MGTDPQGTLAALARIGYREVELHSLYRLSATDFREILDAHGLSAPATHVGINLLRTELDRVMRDAATLGHRWLIVPSLDRADRTADGYRRVAAFFNEIGPRVKQAGFRLGYHNHEYDLPPQDGGVGGLEILIQRTDPAFVDFEVDLFWAVRGGADPVQLFGKYPGRFVAVHSKDMAADGKMVNVGEGTMNFAAMFEAGRKAGVKHFFVEHDNPTDALNDVRVSFAAMQKLLNS